jgi:hypothetical protein
VEKFFRTKNTLAYYATAYVVLQKGLLSSVEEEAAEIKFFVIFLASKNGRQLFLIESQI